MSRRLFFGVLIEAGLTSIAYNLHVSCEWQFLRNLLTQSYARLTLRYRTTAAWTGMMLGAILALFVVYAGQHFLIFRSPYEKTIPYNFSTSTRAVGDEEAVKQASSKSTGVISEVGGQDESSSMASEDLIIIRDCPFALDAGEAKRKENQTFRKAGNKIELTDQSGGRAGNHFMLISGYLAMGFCCRARLVTLPGTDDTFPGGRLDFRTKHRWFGFSNVTVPWKAYQGLRWNKEICVPDMNDGGNSAFGYKKLQKKLLRCMNQVFLRGCEAAYLGQMVQTSEVCPRKAESSGGSGAGSLVIHIRSGDIFDPEGEGRRRGNFGQPPVEFFLMAMRAKNWDDVTVLTSAEEPSQINPTFRTLEVMDKAGSFGMEVRFFSERSLQKDLREMLCADAIATSRSSLSYLTLAHSRAKVFFVPCECGPGTPHRAKHRTWKAMYDNTTLLMLERPEAEVYGVEYDRGEHKQYSVYEQWKNTPEQLLEMLTYSGIKGLKRCSVDGEEGVSGATAGD